MKYDGTNFTTLSGTLPPPASAACAFSGDRLYFPATDSSHGSELWSSDGTNMTRITDIYPGTSSSNPGLLTVFQDALYFLASDATGAGLWKYDGTNTTRAGTLTLNTLNGFVVFNNNLLFGATTNGNDYEPWRYDGTNFALIASINTLHTNTTPVFWTTYHNAAYFYANDGMHNGQLWSYDGTNVNRLTSFGTQGGLYAFTFNDTLYFTAAAQASDYELYRYDGTNISEVADLNPGITGSLPMPLSAYNNCYLIQANDGLHGNELFRLDALADDFRLTTVSRQNDDIVLNWLSPGGWTNVVQVADDLSSPGNFTDLSPAIVSTNQGGLATVSFTDSGGATYPSRYYRLRSGP